MPSLIIHMQFLNLRRVWRLPSLGFGRQSTTVYSGRGSQHCYEIKWNWVIRTKSHFPQPDFLDSIADLQPRAARQLAELRYGAYRIATSAQACQDNSSRYGGWAKKLRIHTWTGMSSQSVYDKSRTLPDPITRQSKNSKEESIWAAWHGQDKVSPLG